MGNKQNAPVTATKAPQASKVSSEISSYRPPEDHEDISDSELSELNLESRQKLKEEQVPTEEVYSIRQQISPNTFTGYQSRRRSQATQSNLIKERLLITQSKETKQFGLDKEVLKVDFMVIVAKMGAELQDSFTTLGKYIYDRYVKIDLTEKQWNLHGNGYFINYEEGYVLGIINENQIYKGSVFTTVDNHILPQDRGVLITSEGLYDGQFRRGKSHGQGTYHSKKDMVIYKGTWVEGVMVKGRIENDFFKFKGTLVNQIANGPGAILFKESRSTYIGDFKNGKYFAYRVKAVYKTKDYKYTGEFVDGKKDGNGVLLEKHERGKLSKTIKYRPADTFDGEWMDDYYITKRQVREERKLLAEEGNEAMGDILDLVLDDSEFNNLNKTNGLILEKSNIGTFNAPKPKSSLYPPIQDAFQLPYKPRQPSSHGPNSPSNSVYPSKPYFNRTKDNSVSEVRIPEEYDEEEEDSQI